MSATTESGPARTERGTILVDLSLEISNGMPAHAFFPRRSSCRTSRTSRRSRRASVSRATR